MQKVTIEDISRDTGLSRGTVSRALNDRPDISAQTKQRVLESCKKLNYVPSHAARSLATGRNYAVAALVDDLRSALTASFLRGVISRAEEARYAVHVLELGPDPQPERLLCLSPQRIDATLNAVALDAALAKRLRQILGNQLMTSCWPLEGVGCDVLTPDQTEAGRMATRFLLDHNCREVLYVHRPTTSASVERLAGFQEVCQAQGIDPEGATVTVSDEQGLEALVPRLERAEAVVATDDFLAVTVMLLGERVGRRPGQDLAVIGHGNEPVSSAIRPSLTTVDSDGEALGQRTMETVLQRLARERMDAPQQTRVAPLLVQRNSTAHLTHSD